MELRPGARLKSVVSTTEVVVVRAPSTDVDLRCGGEPMISAADSAAGEIAASDAQLDPAHAAGALLGKRYADPDSGLEVLCTKAGEGSLALGNLPLAVKGAKLLPSSD